MQMKVLNYVQRVNDCPKERYTRHSRYEQKLPHKLDFGSSHQLALFSSHTRVLLCGKNIQKTRIGRKADLHKQIADLADPEQQIEKAIQTTSHGVRLEIGTECPSRREKLGRWGILSESKRPQIIACNSQPKHRSITLSWEVTVAILEKNISMCQLFPPLYECWNAPWKLASTTGHHTSFFFFEDLPSLPKKKTLFFFYLFYLFYLCNLRHRQNV